MAKCKICGGRIADGATKCPTCGTPVGSTAESLQPKPQARQTTPAQQQVPPAQPQTPPTYGGTTGYSSQAQAAPQPPVQPVQQTVQMPPPPVMSQPQASQSPINGDATEEALMNAYITGTGLPANTYAYQHYRNVFWKFKDGGFLSWNWASGLTFGANLFYRRCWVLGLLVSLIPLILLHILGWGKGFLYGWIICDIILGFEADGFIYNRYKQIANQARSKYPGNKDSQVSYVAGYGGTRPALLLVAVIICPLIYILYFGLTVAARMHNYSNVLEEIFSWLN